MTNACLNPDCPYFKVDRIIRDPDEIKKNVCVCGTTFGSTPAPTSATKVSKDIKQLESVLGTSK
jgi:hypothetical protein